MPLNGSGSSGLSRFRPNRPERALAVAGLAAILFLHPFLGLFDKGQGATIAGIPLLFAYLFVAWTVIIVLTALVMEARHDQTAGPDEVTEGPGSPSPAGLPAPHLEQE